jgi:Domain of unknown function DUF29
MAKSNAIETQRVRYEEDLYAWTQEQAALLRARQAEALDWENLAEEIAAVGGSDRRKLESRLCVILLHLLKWQAQPALRGASWRKTLRTQRREVRKLLNQSPSLRRQVPHFIRDAYRDAVKDAVERDRSACGAFPRLMSVCARRGAERGSPARGQLRSARMIGTH